MDEAKLPRGEPAGTFGPLHRAARERDADEVARLLQAGGDPNGRNPQEPNGDGGNTPLWFAAQGARPGGVPVARELLAAGARVNERCEHGTTALHLAASWAHLDMVQCLVAGGADPRLRDDDGMTPLEMLRAGHTRIQDTMRRGEAPSESENWLARVPAVIGFLSIVQSLEQGQGEGGPVSISRP